jgi:tRNA A-37 threonylcarbamoyl transferase component Bud32
VACKVRYLNSSGIHAREIKGIDGLAAALPSHWLLYASFQCLPKRSDPIEIDAMLVMEDRVLLLELKDWNGDLTANGDQWKLGDGRPRRSPVDGVTMKAKKVSTFLSQAIPGWSQKILVDSRVVLTGTATKKNLLPHEQEFVLNFQEACRLGDPNARLRLLRATTITAKRPLQFEAEFDRVTRNPRLFEPCETLWGGFRAVETDIVVHPRDLWREHRGERARDTRTKALIRIWAFNNLGAGLNNAEQRRFVVERELRAIARLEALNSKLIPAGVLMPIGDESEEILTQHYELRRLPAGWTTLDRFLERSGEDLHPDDRALIAATLLNAVGELHTHGIVHRDLGPRCIWIGSETSQALTGFMACQMPDEASLGNWVHTLRGHGARTGDGAEADVVPAKEGDVRAVARMVLQIFHGSPPTAVAEAIRMLPPTLETLRPWFERALLSGPGGSFQNGVEAAAEFGRALDPQPSAKVDETLFDTHETLDVPYMRWPAVETLQQSARKHVYRAVEPKTNSPIVVKVWFGWRRGLSLQSDLALMRLLVGVGRIRQAARSDMPAFLDYGLSGMGAFVTYATGQGRPWGETPPVDAVQALRRCAALVRAVEALHGMDLDHGDLSPRNAVVQDGGTEVLLIDLFDFSGVDDGRVVNAGLRPSNAELLSIRELDRYAVVHLVDGCLRACDDPRLDDLRGFLGEELGRDRIEILEPVLLRLQEKERALSAQAQAKLTVYVAAAPAGLLQASGVKLFARAFQKTGDTVEYIVSGLERELVITKKADRLGVGRLIATTFKSLSNASERGVALDFEVFISGDARDGCENLLEALKSRVSIVPLQRAAVSSRKLGVAPAATSVRLNLPIYWRRLLELEEEHQPIVEIVKELHSVAGVAAYAYKRLGADFDFDPDERVEVRLTRGGRVGELDLTQTDDNTLAVQHANQRRLVFGDRVTLVERRSRTSFDRRQKAVDRVLNNEAAIKGLIDYFAPDKDVAAIDFGVTVSDEDLAAYDLNDGQQEAFRHVARYGPVALQQGPPGTGKTRFIAAFVHWLVTKQGVGKILIASQSHEAVNNAIEALVDLYRKMGGIRPSLLRIGSKGITEKIRPFHTRALRERYHVRFEAAFKHRVAGLASAMGVRRAFAQDAVDLDRDLGGPARRLVALMIAETNEDQPTAAAERRRNARSLEVASQAFQAAAEAALGADEINPKPDAALSLAFERLAGRHPGVSAGDVRKMRQILELAGEWAASLVSFQRNFEEFLAKTRTVVTATCVGAGQTKIRIDTNTFDWVIIDEAARCTASELAVPIQVGQRILLVGDHLQLKPTIDQAVLQALQSDFDGVPAIEMERSDFERAFTSSYGLANGKAFTEQYRMAKPICDMVSAIFYQPHAVRLTTSTKRSPNVAFDALQAPLDTPAVWIDTSESPDHDEQRVPWDIHTRWNAAEVEATMAVLQRIAAHGSLISALSAGPEETPIGIICMYDGQKTMMDQTFSERSWDARFRRLVRIETVDSYQGKENSIVIMSLVRSNPKLIRGHVASFNRCNVSLSRAKERLFVIGSRKMWSATSEQEPMRQVLEYFSAGHAGTSILKPEAFA